MRWIVLAAVALAVACSSGDDLSPAPASTLPSSPGGSPASSASAETVKLVFAGPEEEHELLAEVAASPARRATGLMHRESLAEDAGMLFVWPQDTTGAFWMRNTLVPLSVAFVRADGTIIHLADMEPLTEDRHVSPEPYRFAVEANQGWFRDRGIEAGSRVELPPLATAE
jgi:uncharacterized membrane protein (UPF0127 family)